MATTTNYGWTTPDDTALVKDGASAIRTLGTSVDTTTKNLNPSTPLGDIAEVTAIQKVFGDHAYNLNISSTKSMTGHLLGAAGAVEAIAVILSVQNDIIPPTINHFTDDPGFDPRLNFTFNNAQKRTVNAALSNTFGFGGHNASVIFKKYKA
jgi:3-oxoacyl-[acyl-carrier-protein] synthase II